MRKYHLSLDAAIPAEFKTALASHMIALLSGLEATAELAPPRTGLPPQGQGTAPSVLVLQLCLGAPPLPALLLLALATRHAWVRPKRTLAAEAVPMWAAQICHIPTVI